MSKKYFVVSDIHGHYTELKNSLDEAGWDRKNKNHILICCGDIFDRGTENIEVYKFLKNIPKTRRKLIKGNHEYLLLKMVEDEHFSHIDYSNGTMNTLLDFVWNRHKYFTYYDYIFIDNNLEWEKEMVNKFKEKSVYKWLLSDEWINYFELKNYIFVHSFIPLHDDVNFSVYYSRTDNLHYFKEWRTEATKLEWQDSTWGCPYKLFDNGLYQEDKTLVCGHWHANDFHSHYGESNSDNMYISDKLIALDACTVLSKKVNVLVIDE